MNDKKFKPMKEITKEQVLDSIKKNFDNNRKVSHDFNDRVIIALNNKLDILDENKEYKNAR